MLWILFSFSSYVLKATWQVSSCVLSCMRCLLTKTRSSRSVPRVHWSALSSRGGASFFSFLCALATFISLTYSATSGCPWRCCGTPALQTVGRFDHGLEPARCSWVEGELVAGLLLDFFLLFLVFLFFIHPYFMTG